MGVFKSGKGRHVFNAAPAIGYVRRDDLVCPLGEAVFDKRSQYVYIGTHPR
jgi:hypothetical protein